MKYLNKIFLLSFLFLFSIFSKIEIFAGEKYFTISSKTFNSGDKITVKFNTAMKSPKGNQYWITIIDKKLSDSEYGEWQYVLDKATSVELIAPQKGGDYEIRLHSDYPKMEYNVVQREAVSVKGKSKSSKNTAKFTEISATYTTSNDNWTIYYGEKTGTLQTTYTNNYGNWTLEMPFGNRTISLYYTNNYTKWVYSGDNVEYEISTVYTEDFSSWEISGKGVELSVSTTYSDNYTNWTISGTNDGMEVSTTYTDNFSSWTIDDNIPDINADIRMAAIFTCLIAPVIIPLSNE